MINVEVPGVIILLVGELQPVRMTNLLWLKGGVQVFDGDYSLWAFGLLNQINELVEKMQLLKALILAARLAVFRNFIK